MIKVGDTYTIKDTSHGASSAIMDSHGLRVVVTIVPDLRINDQEPDMVWVRILEGPWQGVEAPCLVTRLEKQDA